MKDLKELMLEKIDELGWWIREYDGEAEIGQFSDAGEDFFFSVQYKNPFEMSEEINRYHKDFDPEEHAMSVYGIKGAPGIRALLEDADEIDNMLYELKTALSEIVKSWCKEHGIDGSET